MNQKGFVNIAIIIGIVVIAGIAGYFVLSQRTTTSPIPTPTPTPPISTSTTPTPTTNSSSNTIMVSLGKEFTLKKNQVAKIGSTGLEVKIAEFYNSPCPAGGQCFWSGVGIGFEYHFNGEVQKGINLVQAFGYQTKIVMTDHKTYATLSVEKMKVALSQCLPSGIKLDDVVSADISGYSNGQPVGLHKVTVEQKLTELNASCNNGKLVDSVGKEITFYHLTGCWGNPPYNYQEILQKQQDEINKLKEQYTVVEMTCNPSGIPIP